jgi:hypothetical protein
MRAKHPRRALNTAKADKVPVEWFLWFSTIWGAFETRPMGMVHSWRNATAWSARPETTYARVDAEQRVWLNKQINDSVAMRSPVPTRVHAMDEAGCGADSGEDPRPVYELFRAV